MAQIAPQQPLVGLPTARRELRQGREAATVAESECGRPAVFLSRASRLLLLTLLLGVGDKARADEGTARVIGRMCEAVPQVAGLAFVEPPLREPAFPFLPGEDTTRSVSIGDTSHGALVNGVELVESEALGILPVQRERGLRYGTESLVGAIGHAAAALHAASATRLWVGNLSRRGGGDIGWSVSHNSGRDADIAFCYRDLKGNAVDPPDLVPLNREGIAKAGGMRFDPARTWMVVKALIEYEGAQIQYLFIASSLRSQLLEAAKKAGEKPALMLRAAELLRYPVGSAPHNDHLHLRVFCSERDVGGGCENTGAVHPGISLFESERGAVATRAVALLDGEAADDRRRALDRLALLGVREHLGAIGKRLDDTAAPVRAAAVRALAALGRDDEASVLAARFAAEPELEVRLAIVEAIGKVGGKDAGLFLADAVGAPRRSATELFGVLGMQGAAFVAALPDAAQLARDAVPDLLAVEGDRVVERAAIDASAFADRLEPVPRLMTLLEDREPAIRAAAAHGLRMITNQGDAPHVDWRDGTPEILAAGRAHWQRLWTKSSKAPRAAWVASGFTIAGYQIPRLSQENAWELVRAVAGAEHQSYNAQRALMRLFQHRPGSLGWDRGEACAYWLRYVDHHRDDFGLDKAPSRVARACASPD
jgi:murein endopeptidase